MHSLMSFDKMQMSSEIIMMVKILNIVIKFLNSAGTPATTPEAALFGW